MKSFSTLASMAMLAGAAFAQRNATTELKPIINPDCDRSKLGNIKPSSRVDLKYGRSGNSFVDVSLDLDAPAVLLEDIKYVSQVACTDDSVAVTFTTVAAFARSIAEWSGDDAFVIFTNHLGNCDAVSERGIFYSTTVTWDNSTLTVTANSEKSDLTTIASATEITFSNLPVQRTADKREIIIDEEGVTVKGNVSLPAGTTIASVDPYVTIVADEAYVGAEVTFSGYLRYWILNATVDTLYFDVDASLAAELGLSVDLAYPYTQSFDYAPDVLSFALVDVPGIIKFGPALVFSVGVELAAEVGVYIDTELSLSIPDGNIHIDFLNGNNTKATGWTPVFEGQANITEQAVVDVNPYLELTVELAVELLGGVLDLSGGVTAQPKLFNDFTLTANQTVGTGGNSQVDDGDDETCENGLNIESRFEFNVIGFVTEFWEQNLYSVTVPIVDECYSWL